MLPRKQNDDSLSFFAPVRHHSELLYFEGTVYIRFPEKNEHARRKQVNVFRDITTI